jgi:hypothetical protein
VRLVSGSLWANPLGLSAPPMGPAQAPLLPRSTGDPIAYWLYFHNNAINPALFGLLFMPSALLLWGLGLSGLDKAQSAVCSLVVAVGSVNRVAWIETTRTAAQQTAASTPQACVLAAEAQQTRHSARARG